MRWLAAIAVLACLAAAAEERRNVFDDPFQPLTHGLANCPAPPGPLLTEAEARQQAHGRVERGTSCFRAGRCRLPNSYLYDKEIMPRVQKAVDADGRFDRTTSVWATGQRRWIWLQGCVSTEDESKWLETLVRGIDDVEGVVNELVVRLCAGHEPFADPSPAADDDGDGRHRSRRAAGRELQPAMARRAVAT